MEARLHLGLSLTVGCDLSPPRESKLSGFLSGGLVDAFSSVRQAGRSEIASPSLLSMSGVGARSEPAQLGSLNHSTRFRAGPFFPPPIPGDENQVTRDGLFGGSEKRLGEGEGGTRWGARRETPTGSA